MSSAPRPEHAFDPELPLSPEPAMLQRILFVDDEPLMLTWLARILRPMRHEWEMTFELGGRAGQAALAASSYDVVVSDMRMPEIDGSDVLRDAGRLQPGAMRIILSGQASHEAGLRSVQTAHQCLSKPCEAATLIGKIRTTLTSRNALGGGNIATAVARMNSLPSRPEARRRLMAELLTPNPSTRQIAPIIASDLGMTCKILQVANSAFFSNNQRETASVSHGVSSIGLDIVRQLALSDDAFQDFDCAELVPFIDELSRQGIETRDLSEGAATHAGLTQPMTDAASTAGLLHDVGKLVFATIHGPGYGEILRRSRETATPLWQIERDELGASHADVGAYLLALWGIPNLVVDAVARHHQPHEEQASESSPATVLRRALSADRLHGE